MTRSISPLVVGLLVAAVALLGVEASADCSRLPLKSGLSHSRILTPNGAPLSHSSLLHASQPLGVSTTNTSAHRRFLLDNVHFTIGPITPIDFTGLSKLMKDMVQGNISETLPASAEYDHHCRFDMKSPSHSDFDKMKALYQSGYVLCTLCDSLTDRNDTCSTVGVCRHGSACTWGYNLNYHQGSTGLPLGFAPPAVHHGCCQPHQPGCLSRTYLVSDHHHLPKALYRMHSCGSSLCNQDSHLSPLTHRILDYVMDGGWGSWTSTTQCSVTCGTGHYIRHRYCNHPTPQNGGSTCAGSSTGTVTCHQQPCAINGNWGQWSSYGHCSVTCGTGSMSRSRHCDHPKPQYGGHSCVGASTQSTTCTHKPCVHVVDGHWGSWSKLSSCSVTCGTGHMTQTRDCDNPAPQHGGSSCVGDSVNHIACHETPCPVNGLWGAWASYGACSVTCGTGNKIRSRKCDHPAPQYGGHSCAGTSSQSIACNNGYCPVDGGWGSWTSYGHCSVTCGPGNKTRTRKCNHPAPQHGGQVCPGATTEKQSCSPTSCPVNGGWGPWTAYSPCSVTCGAGNRTRNRLCNSPSPQHGGVTCAGSSLENSQCKMVECPVNGGWSTWSAYSACSVTCGDGTKSQSRKCDNPVPLHGGQTCLGSAISNTTCRVAHCSVDGNWTAWSQWGKCSASCSHGNQTRTRSCTNPAPAHGGATCSGNSLESMTCDAGPCPVWSGWFHGDCSVTCGQGTVMRMRHCQSGHDEDCPGKAFETTKCQEKPCPVDGQWGGWQAWGACSASCAGGTHIRGRNCSNPVPSNGGADCQGPQENEAACNTQACPVWSNWYQVSACSVTCGEGVMRIKRDCSSGTDSDCTGSAYDERKCSGPAC